MNKSDKATANFSFTASASASHRVLGGQVPRRVQPRPQNWECWMFISTSFDLARQGFNDVAQDRLLDEKVCNKYCGPRLERNHSPCPMILRTCHVDLDILRILWPERVLSICDPETDSGMKKRHAHRITVRRSHNLYVSNWEPLGTKEMCFIILHSNIWHSNIWIQMDISGLELELGIVAESCALRRVWTPLWNFEKAQVWCLSKTPRKYWSIEAKCLTKS